MKPQKNLDVYNMLVSLIKSEEESIGQVRAMEDEVWFCIYTLKYYENNINNSTKSLFYNNCCV